MRLNDTVRQMTNSDAYPEGVAVTFSSTAALASASTNGIKYFGKFTLQVHGDGPVSLLLADITSAGEIRGYARHNCENLNSTEKCGAFVPRLLGNGQLAFFMDQGPDKNRCQGITELIGSSLADCARACFRDSEQQDTMIILGSDIGQEKYPVAAGLMTQKTPDQPIDLKI